MAQIDFSDITMLLQRISNLNQSISSIQIELDNVKEQSHMLAQDFIEIVQSMQKDEDETDQEPIRGWDLQPVTRKWISLNMPLYYGPRPGFPLLREHIEIANRHNAGLFLNNLYGQRRGHHHDTGWPEDKLEQLQEEFSRYTGPGVQLYLCIKRYDDGVYSDVDDDRIRTHWLGLVEQFRGWVNTAIEIGIDVGSADPNRWRRVHEEILRPGGVDRTVLEASVRDSSNQPKLDVPHEWLHQHSLARWDGVDSLPRLTIPGSALLWMTNHAWKNEKDKAGVIRSTWGKGYALALEADDIETYHELLI